MAITLLPALPTDDPIAPAVLKRGRGRPPGSKNKKVTIQAEVSAEPEQEQEPEQEPEQEQEPEPPQTPTVPEHAAEQDPSSESESETPPPPVRRPRPAAIATTRKPPRKRVARVREPSPETPRTSKRRLLAQHRDVQTVALTARKQHFATILDRFMCYEKRQCRHSAPEPHMRTEEMSEKYALP